MSTTQRTLAIIIILALLGGIYWYFARTSLVETTPDTAQLPNPASVHCVEELGGTLTQRDTPEGQVGVCNLPDGRQCEEWELYRTGNCVTPWIAAEPPAPADTLSEEVVEEVGFNFILDFVKMAPPNPDPEASDRVYGSLSADAKASVSLETITEDILQFIGVEDFPDQGASIEDLQIDSDMQATLVVGLNYSDSLRVLRAIELIQENNKWKVHKVYALEPEYDKGG